MATGLRAGLPLVQALGFRRQRGDEPGLKAGLADGHDRVRAGAALSEAFEAQGNLIPGMYTATLLRILTVPNRSFRCDVSVFSFGIIFPPSVATESRSV